MELSESDLELLAEIDDRAKIVRTRIRSVAFGYTRGFFLYGPAGHGKSHIVTSELEEILENGTWKRYKGDMSSRGLIDKLKEYPTAIHLLEDMERVFKEDKMQGFLRAALAGPKGDPREITDTKHRRDVDFIFSGGIIILSNDPIDHRYGRLGAIASRTHPMLWRLSMPELGARMRDIALQGFNGLTPEECMEVAAFVIQEMESRQLDTKVDLRTFCEGALPDYRQWKDEKSAVHWKKVVQARIQGEPVAERREERLARHREIACRIRSEGMPGNAEIRMWKEQTGLGKTAFYDRLKEGEVEGLLRRNGQCPESRKVGNHQDHHAGIVGQ